MRYGVNFQHLPRGAALPIDRGDPITKNFTIHNAGLMLLPNVGDYVDIDQSTMAGAQFEGRVRSRFFTYVADYCIVNIVVEEADDEEAVVEEADDEEAYDEDGGKLAKE